MSTNELMGQEAVKKSCAVSKAISSMHQWILTLIDEAKSFKKKE